MNVTPFFPRQQKPWGSEKFRREIEVLMGRAVEVRPRGRPAKATG